MAAAEESMAATVALAVEESVTEAVALTVEESVAAEAVVVAVAVASGCNCCLL